MKLRVERKRCGQAEMPRFFKIQRSSSSESTIISAPTRYNGVQNWCPVFLHTRSQRMVLATALGKHFTRLLSPPKNGTSFTAVFVRFP